MPDDKPKQDALGGPNLAAVYHNWFEGHAKKAGEAPPKGEDEATFQELLDIQSGKSPLPPGSTMILDLEPMPHGCEQLYWPTWHFKATREDGSVVEGDLNNENHAIDGFVGIQSPDRPDGVWTKSSGYRLICGLDPKLSKGKLEISGRIGNIDSGTLVIPWISHP